MHFEEFALRTGLIASSAVTTQVDARPQDGEVPRTEKTKTVPLSATSEGDAVTALGAMGYLNELKNKTEIWHLRTLINGAVFYNDNLLVDEGTVFGASPPWIFGPYTPGTETVSKVTDGGAAASRDLEIDVAHSVSYTPKAHSEIVATPPISLPPVELNLGAGRDVVRTVTPSQPRTMSVTKAHAMSCTRSLNGVISSATMPHTSTKRIRFSMKANTHVTLTALKAAWPTSATVKTTSKTASGIGYKGTKTHTMADVVKNLNRTHEFTVVDLTVRYEWKRIIGTVIERVYQEVLFTVTNVTADGEVSYTQTTSPITTIESVDHAGVFGAANAQEDARSRSLVSKLRTAYHREYKKYVGKPLRHLNSKVPL